jgi:hypothetical protein
VKQVAVEHGLDNNQSALLDAARQPTPETQIEALQRRAERKPAHDLVAHPLPAKDIARPLRDLTNLSAGELARWIKITTPNDRPHVIRVLETAANSSLPSRLRGSHSIGAVFGTPGALPGCSSENIGSH